MGAGKPTVIDMKNGLARGVRTASDFLMALQLTGAAKADSIANLQLRLPVVVIGGGLTAVDTATESLAYYPVQVEKFLSRYEALVSERGETLVRALWSEEDRYIADEFLDHGKAIRAEKALAAKEGREPDVWSLLDSWGGVKLVYRKRLIDAPSYRLNHEEVEKAFEEGIFFSELYEPESVEVDQYGYADAINLKRVGGGGDIVTLPARSILVAAGTSPNTVLGREDPAHFAMDGKYFRATDLEGNVVKPQQVSKPAGVHVLMSQEADACSVSFFGDLHPSFAGNVVKAMGSAKQGYPVVTASLHRQVPYSGAALEVFLRSVSEQLTAKVHAVNRLTPTIVEVVIHAPLAARMFEPGQFYRLQNFEALAPRVEHHGRKTVLAMEGLAMTGAWVDKEKGLISVIALEMGGSSDLCAHLRPGEPVILMGPTGMPTAIPANEKVMLVGGGLGNAVLFSIGKAMRAAGSEVLYFAGYKKSIDRYKVEEIEQAADIIVWCCDDGAFEPSRPQDRSFHGNIVEGIRAYGEGKLGLPLIPLPEIDHIIAIGSDRMMQAVAAARHGVLHHLLKPNHVAIGSINSPMQCMMKEICAQCLQKHVDPKTGKEYYVYSCFNQDQLLDNVSFPHLNERLKQNTVQEKLTAQWLDSCLRQLNMRKNVA
jgi:NAD(P)H-flavin reductase